MHRLAKLNTLRAGLSPGAPGVGLFGIGIALQNDTAGELRVMDIVSCSPASISLSLEDYKSICATARENIVNSPVTSEISKMNEKFCADEDTLRSEWLDS
jgi:hypothetical protein